MSSLFIKSGFYCYNKNIHPVDNGKVLKIENKKKKKKGENSSYDLKIHKNMHAWEKIIKSAYSVITFYSTLSEF